MTQETEAVQPNNEQAESTTAETKSRNKKHKKLKK
jgi:hypothetical protein